MLSKSLVVWVAGTLLLLSGCVFGSEDSTESSGSQEIGGAEPVRTFDLDPVVIVSHIPVHNVNWNGGAGTNGAEPVLDDEDIPTDIIIATCESDPTEVAVPLNADDGKFCDTVQIYPYRSDDNGSYGVSGAVIEWVLPQNDVALFSAPAYGPGGNVRKLAALTDAFWSSDKWDEPETLLTVCAKPPTAYPAAFQPICRSLPVRATINAEGSWCFSGETFQGDCHDVEIRQDGRELHVDDDVLADGQLLVRSVTFNRDNDYIYDGILDSHDYMYGIVRLNGHTDVLGTWTAWKLPMY